MIAIAREYREEQHVEQPAEPAWHAGFLAILPQVREQLRFAFRNMPPSERAEALSETIARVTVEYAKLHEQGKQALAFPTTLACYAIRAYYGGRRVGTPLNLNDISSRYCQHQRGFCITSLDKRTPDGQWRETLVEDRRASPAELAAARLDIADWFDGLPRLKRGIAETLATGESTKQTASIFGVTPGRVSQVRNELAESWQEFQGEALACA
jgi:hypothetical protein